MASFSKWVHWRWRLLILFLLIAAAICVKFCSSRENNITTIQKNNSIAVYSRNDRESVQKIPSLAKGGQRIRKVISPAEGEKQLPMKVYKEVEISSTTPSWVDTGLSVKKDQKISIEQLAGAWTVDRNSYPAVDGNGHIDDEETSLRIFSRYKIVPSAHFGAIIAKIYGDGSGGEAFLIGINREILARESGKLYVRINDKDEALADNAGSIKVRICVE